MAPPENRARGVLFRARERSLAKRANEATRLQLSDEERAADEAKWEAQAAEDRAEREEIAAHNVAEAKAREAAGYAPWGTPLDELDHRSPKVTPRQRRYLRVQECLDEVEALERQKSTLAARQLKLIEAGRREALATEYAYPLPATDTTMDAAGESFHVQSGEPETADAVPVKFSASSVADLTYTSMVATTLTISAKAAEMMVHLAEPLSEYFSPTLRLLEEGGTSYRHAQAVVDNGWSVPAEYKSEYEAILLPFASTLTPPQFARKARAVAATYQEDPTGERHIEALQRRRVTITPCDDGMAELTVYMDAVAATAIYNRIRATGRATFRKESGRTRTQTDADVAAELLLTGTTVEAGTPIIDQLNHPDTPITPVGVVFREVPDDESGTPSNSGDSGDDAPAGGPTALGAGAVGTGLGAGILGKVAIHVPALTLLNADTEQAYLENYGPISFDTARLIAGNAPGFTRILTDPDTGATLSVGTKQYKVPDSTRSFILYRDRTCRFPGCSVPANSCDLDHAVEWQFGGETKVSNLAALCRKHHIVKGNTAWDYTMTDAGVLVWVSPSGREETTHPANHIPVATSHGTVIPDVGIKKEPERTDALSDSHNIWDVGTDDSLARGDLPF